MTNQMCNLCGRNPAKYGGYCGPCFDSENISAEDVEAAAAVFDSHFPEPA